MSDYFRAAAKCDPRTVQQAPMYIDQSSVREEQYKHEKLVEQVLKTRMLLREVDATFRTAEERADAEYRPAPTYTPPGVVDRARDPSLRQVGASTLRQRALERMQADRAKLEASLEDQKRLELREHDETQRAAAERRHQAARELDSATTAKRHEEAQRGEDAARQAEEERARRERKHPIDIFQSRVALDILAEVDTHDTSSQRRVMANNQQLDEFLDKEKTAKLRYNFRGPSTHIPNGF
jgi:hypothetical protein